MVRVLICGLVVTLAGCRGGGVLLQDKSPAADGLNTRDIIDPPAQEQADGLLSLQELYGVALKVKARAAAHPGKRAKNVLCLSGGGNYGAYSAGVLCGWTQRGDRPEFDVVTGISTGALIAPFAFLGPEYDCQLKTFYTTLKTKDLFKLNAVMGLFGESLADTAQLAKKVEQIVTPEMTAKIAAEHAKGRRLYIGTTELDGKRFIVWDVGEIAARATPESVVLVRKILLGSSAIPGFFPPSKIDVTVDGKPYVERHVDGGVSTALFFRPPYVPEEKRNDPAESTVAGDNVYCIVAGKLYADPQVLKKRSLVIAANSVSTVIYAQGRGDLQRIWTVCTLAGMNFHLTSIPEEYDAPKSSTEFDPVPMTGMFNEGVRQVAAGTVWRTTPPGVAAGETTLLRRGTALTHRQRGAETGPITDSPPPTLIPFSQQGIPAPRGPVK